MITKTELGERIATARKRINMSQAKLGELFGGVSHAAISDIERGKTNLGIEDISRIASVLQVPFEELTIDYSTINRSIFHKRENSESSEEIEINKSISDFEKYINKNYEEK